eukprot:TRINITY_DN19158_c0_g1_i1.p2 TRINITY_DN19158_c0_g1~~TRINITY_DN19158_c0_g1_i1.p2  ORF type:complete len:106 (+),score=21.99 TRINITY_DN19158_c0_g1_i1:254-571(+)
MLERMKPSAHFVNVGRGAVADENALAELLRDRRIAGAYLDVFDPEPLKEESLLWDLPNVIISPHDAATCADNASRVQSIFLNNLDSFVQGKPFTNTVRPALTGKL